MKWLALKLLRLPGMVLIFCVKCYQWLISPWLDRNCRFEPTCSNYFISAIQKYGVILGAMRGLRRISRCHPWNAGGYDPP